MNTAFLTFLSTLPSELGPLLHLYVNMFYSRSIYYKSFKEKAKKGQPIRVDGPKWQIEAKKGTPTMGGTLIILSLTISTVLWTDIDNIYIWLLLFITLSFGLIGFLDDFIKLNKNSHKGLSGKVKLVLQVIFSFFIFFHSFLLY